MGTDDGGPRVALYSSSILIRALFVLCALTWLAHMYYSSLAYKQLAEGIDRIDRTVSTVPERVEATRASIDLLRGEIKRTSKAASEAATQATSMGRWLTNQAEMLKMMQQRGLDDARAQLATFRKKAEQQAKEIEMLKAVAGADAKKLAEERKQAAADLQKALGAVLAASYSSAPMQHHVALTVGANATVSSRSAPSLADVTAAPMSISAPVSISAATTVMLCASEDKPCPCLGTIYYGRKYNDFSQKVSMHVHIYACGDAGTSVCMHVYARRLHVRMHVQGLDQPRSDDEVKIFQEEGRRVCGLR